MRVELGGLLVWWGAWSLGDTYLLPYTPVFEVVSLCVGLVLVFLPVRRAEKPVQLVSET
jgi:hypothetical protein